MLGIFVAGMVMGFVASFGFGPIMLLTINRNLSYGFRSGMTTGLGSATADTLYGAMGLTGVSFMTEWVNQYPAWYYLVTMMILAIIGLLMLQKGIRSLSPKQSVSPLRIHSDYLTALVIGLSNPLMILVYLAVMGALGIHQKGDVLLWSGLTMVGVFCGSVTYWLVVNVILRDVGKRMNQNTIRIINWVAGVIMLILALWAGVKAYQSI